MTGVRLDAERIKLLEAQGEVYREEISRLRSMLMRIKAMGGKIWDGYDCATGAVTALDGPEAGRAHMMARPEEDVK
jgi:hypothetical protein